MKDSLKLLLDDLVQKGIVIHLICICETFLTNANANDYKIENYTAFHACRQGKVGGGVSILVHDRLKVVKRLPTPFNDSFESIALEVSFKGVRVFVGEFYRPPNSNDIECLDGLRDLLLLSNTYSLSVLGADQNYDLLKVGQHKPTANFLQCMLDGEFLPMMSKPTRVTHRSSTLIDNLYIKNKSIMENHAYIIVDPMSHHYPCLVFLSGTQ